jgi:NADPH:quinone reductase-like Zn-dependent oxidoreductase
MTTTETTVNHAILQDGYGDADLLRFAQVPIPKTSADEVLLRVHGAGLDRGTWHTMEGRPYLMRLIGFGLRKPKNQVPGIDVAGTVVGIGSAVKLDLLWSLGADHVIDYTRQDLAEGTQRYDLILDIAGRPSLSRLRHALTPTGTAVIIGGEEGGKWTGGFGRHLRAAAMSPFVSQRLVMFTAKERRSDLERLTELIEAERLTPTLDKTFSLSRVPEAMHYLEAGRARGKVAITI